MDFPELAQIVLFGPLLSRIVLSSIFFASRSPIEESTLLVKARRRQLAGVIFAGRMRLNSVLHSAVPFRVTAASRVPL